MTVLVPLLPHSVLEYLLPWHWLSSDPEYQPSEVKPITLGDYMPTMCKNKVHCDESDILSEEMIK